MDSKDERTKKRFATRLVGLTAAKKFAGRIEEFFLPLSPRRFLKVAPTSRNPPPFHFWTNDSNKRSGSRVNFRNLSWFIAVWNIGWQGRERETMPVCQVVAQFIQYRWHCPIGELVISQNVFVAVFVANIWATSSLKFYTWMIRYSLIFHRSFNSVWSTDLKIYLSEASEIGWILISNPELQRLLFESSWKIQDF